MRHHMKSVFLFLWAFQLAWLSIAPGVLAVERVNHDEANIAIQGYDAVAYFTEGQPTAGSPEFEHAWHDAVWRFSSAEHRDLFSSDPERYAPRYGGFCAGAMARGWRATVDPEAWTIIDGRLYLLFDGRLVDGFVEEADDRIPMADANWERLGQVE